MKIPCSSCNQRLDIPEELAGQTIECPECKASLAVPTLKPNQPPTPQVQFPQPQENLERKAVTSQKSPSKRKPKLIIPKWAIAAVSIVFLLGVFSLFSSSKENLVQIHERFLQIHSEWSKSISSTKSVNKKIDITRAALKKLKKIDVEHLDSQYAIFFNAYGTHLEAGQVALLGARIDIDEEETTKLWDTNLEAINKLIRVMNVIYERHKN